MGRRFFLVSRHRRTVVMGYRAAPGRTLKLAIPKGDLTAFREVEA